MTLPMLNRKLVLEAPERVADGAGGFAETWVARGTHWAEIRPGTGNEIRGVLTALSRVPYRITVRATPAGADSRPRPEQRFRDGTRLFHILAVTERETDGRYLTCHAEEEVVG